MGIMVALERHALAEVVREGVIGWPERTLKDWTPRTCRLRTESEEWRVK